MANSLTNEFNKYHRHKRLLKKILDETIASVSDIESSGYFSKGKSW